MTGHVLGRGPRGMSFGLLRADTADAATVAKAVVVLRDRVGRLVAGTAFALTLSGCPSDHSVLVYVHPGAQLPSITCVERVVRSRYGSSTGSADYGPGELLPRGVSAGLPGADLENRSAGLGVDFITNSKRSSLRVSASWDEGETGLSAATQRDVRRHIAATMTAVLRACVSRHAAETWIGRCEWEHSDIRCPSRADEQ